MATYGSQLLVANAYKDDSYIALYGGCNDEGKRPFVRNLVTHHEDKNLAHPYGISEVAGYVYVTSQDTDSLTRYTMRDIVAGKANASALRLRSGSGAPFAKFGKQQGVRGVAGDGLRKTVYVADEDRDLVHAIDSDSGQARYAIEAPKPVGVHFNVWTRKLYIGSSNGGSSAVHEYSVDRRRFTNKFAHSSVTHPAGIVSWFGKLYVLGQDTKTLSVFNLITGQHTTLIKNLPDAPEQIMVAQC